MNASPATVARSIRHNREAAQAVTQDVRTVTYTSNTGDLSWSERQAVKCAKRGYHVIEVEGSSDLPGDRTVGWCLCGQYEDTGTFDERNA